MAKSDVKIHVLIASLGSDIGYCVSTINPEGFGEIHSLYVKKDHRSKGFGKRMVETALRWLDENNVQKKRGCCIGR